MPLTDPIADLLTRMRNAQHGRRTECVAPHSRIKEQICELLKREGYVGDVEVRGEAPHRQLVVTFLPERQPLALKRISTPGARRYVPAGSLRARMLGFDLAILSTSSGLLTDKQANNKKVGGELLCLVS